MALTYATFKTTLANMAVMDSEDNPEFVEILPRAIEYAENRIYRELDLLNAVVRTNGTLSSGNRDFTLPTDNGRFVTVDAINAIVSSSRTPLVQTSREVIDNLWPSSSAPSASSVPAYYAMVTDEAVIVGPPAGATTTLEVVGKIRPAALSEANTTTFLSSYLPDLFLSASMVFIAGWTKNFGSQSDNPAQAMSWEQTYKTQLASANAEELRKKFGSMPRG